VQRAVDPMVAECVGAFRAETSSIAISRLRAQAEAIARNEDELKLVRKRLHQPTLILREGSLVEETTVLSEIQREIMSLREEKG
jgi:hypothetical protein